MFATFTAPSFGPVHTIREPNGTRLRLPSPQPRRDVPARPLARVHAAARRRRSVPGRGDLPGLLRLRAVRAVEPQRGQAVQAHADLRRARARPPGWAHAEARARAGCACRTSRWRSSSAAASCTSTRSGASTGRATSWPRRPPIRRAVARDAIAAALPKATVPAEARRRRPLRLGPPARRPPARPGRRSAGGRARGRLHREVRDQVDRGGRRRRLPDREGARAAGHALPRPCAAADRERLAARGAEESTSKRMRRWAHQFGFGGHCFTKSRRCSTTFKALREARATHAAGRRAARGLREKADGAAGGRAARRAARVRVSASSAALGVISTCAPEGLARGGCGSIAAHACASGWAGGPADADRPAAAGGRRPQTRAAGCRRPSCCRCGRGMAA